MFSWSVEVFQLDVNDIMLAKNMNKLITSVFIS